jgi:hypothetical protein
MADNEVVSEESAEGVPNYFNYFQIPRTNLAVETTYIQQLAPLETFNVTDSNLKFRINGLPDTFPDMSSIRLNLQFRVLKENGDKLIDTDPTFPAANVFHTLWKQVNCSLNNSAQVTRPHNL